MKSENSRKKFNRCNVGIVLLLMLTAILLSACGGESTGGGSMQDPYEAYGVERGEGMLGASIIDDPPKAIAIQPIMIEKPFYETAMLAVEPMIFEKGTSKSFSFDLQLCG